MFMGEYHHNLDDKSRIVVPAAFRNELGCKFIVARGLEKCLSIYSSQGWEKIVSKLQELSFTKKDTRTFIRSLFSTATICELDRQGRILLPSNLLEYASIAKECIFLGANDHVEIWDKTLWENDKNENEDKLSDIAENLFTGINL